MKDELFADLLASAEEMVRIEKGEQMPMEQHVHTFSEIDVKAIREATGLKQQDLQRPLALATSWLKAGKRNDVTQPVQPENCFYCFRVIH